MATYVVTENLNEDWDDRYCYKYRYESHDGLPVAQAEVERRRATGRPAVLWRWEKGKPTLVERVNV